eukprot:Gb_11650 [translate_table: standard]
MRKHIGCCNMPSISIAPLDLGLQIPYHFRCPISLDLMRDPVVLCTGQTYDRSSIEKWLASGNTTCPVTMQKLQDYNLIPNHTLRRLIQEWCVANRCKGIERIPTPKQPVDRYRVRSLVQEAAASGSIKSARASAIRSLKFMAKDSDNNKSIIADEGVIPVLISSVFSCIEEQPLVGGDHEGDQLDMELTEEALGFLVLFSLTDSERISIAQPTRIAYISSLLCCGSMEVRVNAGSLVESLTHSEHLHEELRALVGNTAGMIEGLVNLIRESLYPRAVKVGIKAIFSLCFLKANREKAVEARAPEALIEGLVDAQKCDAERALAAIELLCRTDAGCKALSCHALTVPILVKTILKVSIRATEYAAGSLLAICSNSESLQEEAVQAGILTQLLLLVQSDCTDRAKRKAQMLLKLLRNAWLDDISCTPDTGRTDVVPF